MVRDYASPLARPDPGARCRRRPHRTPQDGPSRPDPILSIARARRTSFFGVRSRTPLARAGNRKLHLENGIATGGEGGIRTHGTVTRTPDFESGPVNHLGTSPLEARGTRGRCPRLPVTLRGADLIASAPSAGGAPAQGIR